MHASQDVAKSISEQRVRSDELASKHKGRRDKAERMASVLAGVLLFNARREGRWESALPLQAGIAVTVQPPAGMCLLTGKSTDSVSFAAAESFGCEELLRPKSLTVRQCGPEQPKLSK